MCSVTCLGSADSTWPHMQALHGLDGISCLCIHVLTRGHNLSGRVCCMLFDIRVLAHANSLSRRRVVGYFGQSHTLTSLILKFSVNDNIEDSYQEESWREDFNDQFCYVLECKGELEYILYFFSNLHFPLSKFSFITYVMSWVIL